ncbi:hypothetical protein MCEMKE14_01291 [Candidatus Nanopelagicaceae bacterium]
MGCDVIALKPSLDALVPVTTQVAGAEAVTLLPLIAQLGPVTAKEIAPVPDPPVEVMLTKLPSKAVAALEIENGC